ncbi:MAG: hypothetical protein KDJ52_16675 [Anaerolineae bacterium]|nr:hypothetical protein [Anaerolineae bacterium]
MTPVLFGRWQTRFFLTLILGLPVTAFFWWLFEDDDYLTFAILGYVTVIGLGWDALYNHLQTYRWDHDWPPAFQLAAGVVEALLVAALIWGLPVFDLELPWVDPDDIEWWQFLLHYSAVWLAIFLASLSVMRICFPRWRFFGGQIV